MSAATSPVPSWPAIACTLSPPPAACPLRPRPADSSPLPWPGSAPAQPERDAARGRRDRTCPGQAGRGPRRGTGYSDLGITGITPILGLFRSPLLCTRDGPVTWYDALSWLSPVGI